MKIFHPGVTAIGRGASEFSTQKLDNDDNVLMHVELGLDLDTFVEVRKLYNQKVTCFNI